MIASALWMSSHILGCAAREAPVSQLGAPHPTKAIDPDRPCDIPLAEGVTLSALEKCWVERIKARCGEHDPCLVSCFANSTHRPRSDSGFSEMTIGGGCWHLCFAYSNNWQEPEGWDECEGLDWHHAR